MKDEKKKSNGTKRTTVQENWMGQTPKSKEKEKEKIVVLREFCCLFD